MAIRSEQISWRLAAAGISFAIALAVLILTRGAGGPEASGAGAVGAGLTPGASTDERITVLQDALAENPGDAEGFASLGSTYLQKFRESGDASYYSRADEAFGEALANDPDNFNATSGSGALALSRHDFPGALRLGLEAKRINPTISSNYGVIADAQIELGRYGDAARTLQHWIDLRPGLSSYARVSYFRELHGDLPGALDAMRLAVSAGGDQVENLNYVETLAGNLAFQSGDYAGAERTYRGVLARDPNYAPGLAGLGRALAARGELDAAIRRYRRAVEILPLPEHAIALGDAELAAGRADAARRDYALVEVQAGLLRDAGANTDLELALFEADHGDPDRAVGLARDAWRAAPSVRSADALAWALHRDGRSEAAEPYSREAMKLGSRDPSFLFHAGMVAEAVGETGRARDLLGRLVAGSPRFHPLYGPRAERALRELG